MTYENNVWPSANGALVDVLNLTKEGLTKEELSKALGVSTDSIRSRISALREKGEWIVDKLVEGNVEWTNKKAYYITKKSEEFFNWQIRQQGNRIKPLLGPPRV